MSAPSLRERLALLVQYCAPHHLLTAVVHGLTRWRFKPWTQAFIGVFRRLYQPDLTEMAAESVSDFSHVNAFFTRELRPGVRPIDGSPNTFVAPADSAVSQFGSLTDDQILQAKGVRYSASALLGAEDEWSAGFRGGEFITLYLAPRDYHRVHMPCNGVLRETRYVPGRLFSVAPLTTRHVPGLFARNERLVTLFETPYGRVAQILVGAMLVAAIETVWDGPVRPARAMRKTRYDGTVRLARGEEMGRFGMGSTVIVITEPGAAHWLDHIRPSARLRVGEAIATAAVCG